MSPSNLPGDPGWPSQVDWDRLNESVNGRLIRPVSPVHACKVNPNSDDSDEAFRALIERFVEFYEEALNNEHWGEQFAIRPDNSIEIVLLFQDLSEEEVASTWAPLKQWVEQDAAKFSYELEPIFIPAREMWNFNYWKENHPELVELNLDPGHGGIEYWWASNSAEVSAFCFTYQSRWIPLALFRKDARKVFADKLFTASRYWPLAMHINKGLAGAAAERRAARQKNFDPSWRLRSCRAAHPRGSEERRLSGDPGARA